MYHKFSLIGIVAGEDEVRHPEVENLQIEKKGKYQLKMTGTCLDRPFEALFKVTKKNNYYWLKVKFTFGFRITSVRESLSYSGKWLHIGGEPALVPAEIEEIIAELGQPSQLYEFYSSVATPAMSNGLVN